MTPRPKLVSNLDAVIVDGVVTINRTGRPCDEVAALMGVEPIA